MKTIQLKFSVWLMTLLIFCISFTKISIAVAHEVQFEKTIFAEFEDRVIPGNPRIALNTITGESLVVWEKFSETDGTFALLARIIDSRGKQKKGPFALVSSTTSWRPSVAYNPASNEFFVVYADEGKIFALRLDRNGKSIGKPKPISNDAASSRLDNSDPRVVTHPITGGYAVLWTRSGPGQSQDEGLVGVLVDRKGKVTSQPLMIRRPQENRFREFITLFDLSFQSDKNLLLVVFQPVNPDEGDYLLLNVDPMLGSVKGKEQKVNTNVVTRHGQVRACLAVLENGSGIVFFGDTDNLKRRGIDANGKLSGKNLPAMNSPVKKTRLTEPRVAFAKTANGVTGLLIVTQDGGPGGTDKEWAQVLRSDGSPLAAPIQVNETGPDAITQFGSVLGVVPSSSASGVTHFVWVGTVLEESSVLLEEYEGGMIKLKLDVTLNQ